MQQGMSVGAVYALHKVASSLGIAQALGKSREANLALWQIYARIIAQGSRLSAVRLAAQHAICDILDLQSFHEDNLYENLDWLAENQAKIEDKLFFQNPSEEGSQLFLYDVTSSYTEGEVNAYADYGYNRDKKKGKKQIVIGLLTDVDGDPISVQVFKGNTSDSNTVADQVYKCCKRFKVLCITFVGDRGMIKGPQIKSFPENFHYITSLTKLQIEKLIKEGKFQLDYFCNEIKEVVDKSNILRRNPIRQQEIQDNREDKLNDIKKLAIRENEYLRDHPRASEMTAVKRVLGKIKKLKINKWVSCKSCERKIDILIDEEALSEESQLDGCYVIKTDVPTSFLGATPNNIHDRYKDLSHVEWAFRSMKTSFLELRPYYVRKADRTEGHVFVVMLAYKIIRYLNRAWSNLNITVEEGIHELGQLCLMHLNGVKGTGFIPKPNKLTNDLLELLGVELPQMMITKGVIVATRKRLQNERLIH
jgi:transposase